MPFSFAFPKSASFKFTSSKLAPCKFVPCKSALLKSAICAGGMKAMEKRLSFASYAKCLQKAMKSPYNKQLKLAGPVALANRAVPLSLRLANLSPANPPCLNLRYQDMRHLN